MKTRINWKKINNFDWRGTVAGCFKLEVRLDSISDVAGYKATLNGTRIDPRSFESVEVAKRIAEEHLVRKLTLAVREMMEN